MRAAYLEYLDEIKAGRGQAVLEKRIDVAFHEPMRYRANRIAQTELHRAYAERQAVELMEDEGVGFVQIRMSQTHPKTDICDYYAKVDRYGLGKGVYPKALAPRPGFHPFCRCIAVGRTDIRTDTKWRERPEAAQAWLRAQGLNAGAAVMGSRARRDAVLKGADPGEVWNSRIAAQQYRVGTVGEVSREGWVTQQLGGYPGAALRKKPDNGAMSSQKIVSFAREAMRIADRKTEINLGKVENADRILRETGLDVSGFERVLDNYGVRHTMKRHGNEKTEAKRGQIAVTFEDFDLIPLITSRPDSVFQDGKNKVGRDVIVFTKLIDGIGYRHVEEIRPKGKLVATDSLRKKKGAWGS